MEKERILYVCANDGSDTRVFKEITSLSKQYKVFYLGIGAVSKSSFSLEATDGFLLIPGSHKSIKTLIRLIYELIKLLFKFNFKKVHVVDEQFYIFLLPFLIRHKVILDIFDSYFLKLNFPNNKAYFLKRIVYGLPHKLIVTDENRYDLLPKFAQNKAEVIPNVPNFHKHIKQHNYSDDLIICYFGSLHKDRGTDFLETLMRHDNQISIIAAGWLMDDYTKSFVNNPRVTYLGVKRQSEVNEILAKSGDYLLSIYPVNNTNNIYASPNKIYDAIQTQTPVIINSEIIVAKFVEENNFGFVISDIKNTNFEELIFELKKRKHNYNFNPKIIEKYSWEMYESKLINL